MLKGKQFTNKEVAHLLESVAAAYIIKRKNRFRIMAYQRASAAVEHLTSEVKDLWEEGKLEEIPGVGKGIASHLDELLRKGKVFHFETIFKGLPKAMFELMKIPGIGPKKAYKLAKKLKIKDPQNAVKKLKEAIRKGKIKEIEGFAVKSEAEISRSLREFGRKGKRILLSSALLLSQDIIFYLKKCPEVKRVDSLGSLRRRCVTVGDIDIAVASDKYKEVIQYFINYSKKIKVIEAGEKKASILLHGEYQVDLRVESADIYGALLQHLTGSKQHNIHLREIAKEKSLSLSEYGIKEKNKRGKERMKKFATEEAFYNYLGMSWIPPELREDSGEIELAQKGKLPKLVDLKDIKGDLQMHTSFDLETSHDLGNDSMEDLVKKGLELGYQYLAFTDHNPSFSHHNENQIIAIIKRRKELIDKINYSLEKTQKKLGKKLFVFNSLEVDIRPNGQRAIPDKALAYLDFFLVSIHSSFRMDRKSMTERILKGFNHPKAKILAHPTGRMLNKRESYELDWPKIFEFCRQNKKFLEINAFPDRLDLPDVLVKEAIKNGIKLVVSTDAHATSHLDFMKFGVYLARRGWAKKDDIINALNYNQIRKLLI